jgi:hypothetical protein
MAKFTKIPETAFKKIQLNAGVILSDFEPTSGTLSNEDIIGATSGGTSFTAVPTFKDYGEGIDNCPKNMMELKDIDTWDINMSGSFVTVDSASAKKLIAAADVAGEKITPRNFLKEEDFSDIWWVGDYSDVNDETNGGFIAIHMMNALSTGGFSVQTADKEKGTFAYSFAAHYSMAAQDTVPFEVYIKAGKAS